MSSRADHPAGPASQGFWRKRLERRILRHLRGLKPDQVINQRQLALHLGELTSTVHYAVARLSGRGYVEYVKAPGRAKPIRLCPDRVLAAGLAVDKGYLRLTLLNLREEVVAEHTLPQPNEPGLSLARFTERIEDMLQQALGPSPQRVSRAGDKPGSPRRGSSRPLSIGNLSAICVAVNGLVDPATGMVIEYSTFGWRDVPLAAALANRLGCPVTVIGTASLAEALSEAMAGVGRGYESMVYFRVGDGITPGSSSAARCSRARSAMAASWATCRWRGNLRAEPAASAARPIAWRPTPPGPRWPPSTPSWPARRPAGCPPRRCSPRWWRMPRPGSGRRKVIQRAMDLWTVGVLVSLNAYDPAVLALGGWCLRSHPELANQLAQRVRRGDVRRLPPPGAHRPRHRRARPPRPGRRLPGASDGVGGWGKRGVSRVQQCLIRWAEG